MGSTADRRREPLVSNRLAVASIALLFGASLAGWVFTEIVAADFPGRRAQYEAAWGKGLSTVTAALRLFDPFHSFWYRAVLAFFIVTLFLCIVTRLVRIVPRIFRLAPPAGAGAVDSHKTFFELSWRPILMGPGGERDPVMHYGERYGRRERVDAGLVRAAFSRTVALLSRRGYRVVSREADGGMLFTAAAGRVRHAGMMLFHVGILVVAIGGVIGSLKGWSEMVYGKAGDTVPLRGSALTLAVRDFEIIMNERGEVRDYITAIAVVGPAGDTLAEGTVEVNKPFGFEGYRVHQSEFFPEERSFSWARIDYVVADSAQKGSVTVRPGEQAALEGTSFSILVLRYFPDFRIGPDGPSSASPFPENPAVEVEVAGEEGSEKGFLFLRYPRFNSLLKAPVRLGLAHLEPLFYTGLLVGRSPGAPVILVGIAAGTLGLLLLYLRNQRTLCGVIDAERIRIAAAEYRWKVSFERELASLEKSLADEIGAAVRGQGGVR